MTSIKNYAETVKPIIERGDTLKLKEDDFETFGVDTISADVNFTGDKMDQEDFIKHYFDGRVMKINIPYEEIKLVVIQLFKWHINVGYYHDFPHLVIDN